MKKRILMAMLALQLYALPALAAADGGSFAAIYRDGFEGLSTTDWIIVGAVAAGSAVAVYFSAGTATPVVTGIGTTIGGWMGFSGIAATNAGLALLGGGSLASGGLGVAGGAAGLTAVLSFAGGVSMDYAVAKGMETFNSTEFAALMTSGGVRLPLPNREKGSENYESALAYLEKSKNTNNRKDAEAWEDWAISEVAKPEANISFSEAMQKSSLRAVLELRQGRYAEARETSRKSLRRSREYDPSLNAAVPAYVMAVTEYSLQTPNRGQAREMFAYAVGRERDNSLLPLLYAVYFKHAAIRDRPALKSSVTLNHAYNQLKKSTYGREFATTHVLLTCEYRSAMNELNERFFALSGARSNLLRANPVVRADLVATLEEYKKLNSAYTVLVNNQRSEIQRRIRARENMGAIDFMANLAEDYEWEHQWKSLLDKSVADFRIFGSVVRAMTVELQRYPVSAGRK